MKPSRSTRVFGVFLSCVAIVANASTVEETPKVGASWFDEVALPALLRGTLEPNSSTVNEIDTYAKTFRVRLASKSLACKKTVAQQLGFKVVRGVSGQPSSYNVRGACKAADVSSLGQAEDIKITLGTDSEINSVIKSALTSREAACLYQLRVEKAAKQATSLLANNSNFVFGVQGDFVNVYGSPEWNRECLGASSAYCLTARSSGYRALSVFTNSTARSECAAGLQIAELETQKQLYGQAFDQYFSTNEIRVGAWRYVSGSDSALWGLVMRDPTTYDSNAAISSALGKNAFSGRSGYIGNVYGEAYLDSPDDRGENFMTVSVTSAAAAALKAAGGFEIYNNKNLRLFELSRTLTDRSALRYVGGDYDVTSYGASAVEMQKILRDPVYRGYLTFVHPLGRMTLGQHITRLLQINPRTPYKFQLYPSAVPHELYYRFALALLNQCS